MVHMCHTNQGFRFQMLLAGYWLGTEYTFAITRAPAFGSGSISSITIPALGATCASAATECQEISSAPGTFDIRALDSTSSITLNATFTSGTASYSVNGGASQSLTSGTASNTISLGSGTSLSSRVTTITVTHNGGPRMLHGDRAGEIVGR